MVENVASKVQWLWRLLSTIKWKKCMSWFVGALESFYFLCVVHLANEKGLELVAKIISVIFRFVRNNHVLRVPKDMARDETVAGLWASKWQQIECTLSLCNLSMQLHQTRHNAQPRELLSYKDSLSTSEVAATLLRSPTVSPIFRLCCLEFLFRH